MFFVEVHLGPDGRPIQIWESRGRATGEVADTYTDIITNANAAMRGHDRMPLILAPDVAMAIGPFLNEQYDEGRRLAPDIVSLYVPLILPTDRASRDLPQTAGGICLFAPTPATTELGISTVIGLRIDDFQKAQISDLSKTWRAILDLCALWSKTGLSYNQLTPGVYSQNGQFGHLSAAILPPSISCNPASFNASHYRMTWPDVIVKSLSALIERFQAGKSLELERKTMLALKLYNDSQFENSNEARFLLLMSAVEVIMPSDIKRNKECREMIKKFSGEIAGRIEEEVDSDSLANDFLRLQKYVDSTLMKESIAFRLKTPLQGLSLESLQSDMEQFYDKRSSILHRGGDVALRDVEQLEKRARRIIRATIAATTDWPNSDLTWVETIDPED